MNIAVIFAGGVGKRMVGSAMPKQFLKLLDKPVLIHTLQYFEECDDIDVIVISMVESHIDLTLKLIKKYSINKVKKVVPGGETGQLSIYNGLCAAKEISTSDKDIVLIHDGVRPLITEDLIKKNIESVKKYGSAISCVHQKETTVLSFDENDILGTTDRANTWIARAPQSFYLNDILEAHNKCLENNITEMIDSCSMMLHFNKKLKIVETLSENIKITTPDDFFLAKAIIQARENNDIFGG